MVSDQDVEEAFVLGKSNSVKLWIRIKRKSKTKATLVKSQRTEVETHRVQEIQTVEKKEPPATAVSAREELQSPAVLSDVSTLPSPTAVPPRFPVPISSKSTRIRPQRKYDTMVRRPKRQGRPAFHKFRRKSESDQPGNDKSSTAAAASAPLPMIKRAKSSGKAPVVS